MRSSAGRSISRSSGGHRVGSSRAGSSFSSPSRSSFSTPSRPNYSKPSSYTPPRNSYSTPKPPRPISLTPPILPRTGPIIRNTTIYNNNPSSAPSYSNGNYRNSNNTSNNSTVGCLFSFIVVIIVLAIIIGTISMTSNSSAPASTVNREKLELGIGFNNECIVDEINWFDNVSATSRDLQYFFNKTGVQPYIVLKAYDPNLTTDEAKEAYANQWYDENIANEATFLYMYFAEEDVDNDVGYMVYVNGLEVGPVMDAEAVEIFWSYLDSLWYSDMSTDDLFAQAFSKTADRIMDKTTTGADVGKTAFICITIIAVGVIAIVIMNTKRKHEKEKAEETERILNTPLGNTSLDDLADKYSNMD